MPEDPVDAALSAYLDYRDDAGPEPTLDHLTEGERAEAVTLIGLIEDARGIDFCRPRPSLDYLLARAKGEVA